MVPVRSDPRMAQPRLNSLLLVLAGWIRMESKIILSIVGSHPIEHEERHRVSPLLVWSTVSSERTLIAFSSVSTFPVHLPSGSDPTFALQLLISIRDMRDCVTEWNLTSLVIVRPDSNALDDLLNQLQSPSSGLTNNPLIQLLAYGNQNTVGQVIGSFSQQFNQMNTRNLADAVSSNLFLWLETSIARSLDGVPAASVSVSTLDALPSSLVISSPFQAQRLRWISPNDLDVCSIEHHCLRSVQRRIEFSSGCSRVFDWIHHFSPNHFVEHDSNAGNILSSNDHSDEPIHSHSSGKIIPKLGRERKEGIGGGIESVLPTGQGFTVDGRSNSRRRSSTVGDTTGSMCSKSPHGTIFSLTSEREKDLFQGVNAPLQQRTTVLHADLRAASTFPSDYDTDLESDWSQLSEIVSFPLPRINCLQMSIRMVIIPLPWQSNNAEIFSISSDCLSKWHNKWISWCLFWAKAWMFIWILDNSSIWKHPGWSCRRRHSLFKRWPEKRFSSFPMLGFVFRQRSMARRELHFEYLSFRSRSVFFFILYL